MITLYRDEQINTISYSLNIPKSTVSNIIVAYIEYIRNRIENGEPARFLNICQFRVNGVNYSIEETLAYTANEIGQKLNISPVVVQRVFECYENSIIKDLQSGFNYNIRGLFTIKLEGKSLDITKSFAYMNYEIPIRVMAMGRFKRRLLK